MPATTVKLDAELLREIARVKSRNKHCPHTCGRSLQANLRQRKLRAAAEAYNKLLADSKDERLALEEWEAAPLATTPKRRRK